MLASFAVVTALSATFAESSIKAAGSATVAFLFLFFGFYDIAFTPLSIAYPVEILPFKLRAKGLSINLTTVFGAGFFNQYVNPIALEAIEWRFYFVYVALLAAMIPTIYFIFPEVSLTMATGISVPLLSLTLRRPKGDLWRRLRLYLTVKVHSRTLCGVNRWLRQWERLRRSMFKRRQSTWKGLSETSTLRILSSIVIVDVWCFGLGSFRSFLPPAWMVRRYGAKMNVAGKAEVMEHD